jgi:two-component system, OmpR family, response regulator
MVGNLPIIGMRAVGGKPNIAPFNTASNPDRMMAARQASNGMIAIVEDDPGIRELVCTLIARDGFEVMAFENSHGLEKADILDRIQCLILDLALPGENGLAICQRVRAKLPMLPILIVTANDDPVDRIIGLEVGADDYLTKPFNKRELLARLRSIIRRTRDITCAVKSETCRNFRFEDWLLLLDARKLTGPSGNDVALTTGEFDLLHALVLHPQRVLSREFLIDMIHGASAMPYDRSIDVQMSRLRRKLGDNARRSKMIRTVRGDGYLFAPAVTRC